MSFRVVIVDDEEIDRYIARRNTQKWNADVEVTEFEDPDEALALLSDEAKLTELAAGTEPVVLLLDINMPQMTGFDLLKEVGNKLGLPTARRLLLVAMLTSSDNPRDRAAANASPLVDAYFVKPLTPTQLQQVADLHAQLANAKTP
ncbi:MAG: response regulator [Myxococcota bacterium]